MFNSQCKMMQVLTSGTNLQEMISDREYDCLQLQGITLTKQHALRTSLRYF